MMYDLPFGCGNINESEIRHHKSYIRLFSLHHRSWVNVRCLAYLPPEGTHGNECHQQQGYHEDTDAYRSLYHKLRRMKWAKTSDLFISAHFWAPEAPVYLSEEDLKNSEMRIKMIGDVTCDIMGSIKSTVRPSTHAEPYYDYNPHTQKEEPAFSSYNNITVMAVDTCPNALALDTSAYFGDMLMRHVFEPILKNEDSMVIARSTILKDGKLTERFAYLKDFAESK